MTGPPDVVPRVLPWPDLHEALEFFTGRLGFRLDTIFPADDPRVAVVSGRGLRLRLHRGFSEGGADDPPAESAFVPSFVLTRSRDGRGWVKGRAGMLYRDLVPGRLGGRYVASHLRIPAGGPVPDAVHHHDVAFQLIVVRRGWVRVVYQDQGPPFVLEAGDAVLQPPTIRHRVLEASDGLEVVEVASPAEHATHLDHELELPTPQQRPERVFGGQRFVRHEARRAAWRPAGEGWEARDLGIREASGDRASARVVRWLGGGDPLDAHHDAELLFRFVLRGRGSLRCAGRPPVRLAEGDAVVVPPGVPHALAAGGSPDLELLEVVALPRDAPEGDGGREEVT